MPDTRNNPKPEIKDLSVTQQKEYLARKRKNLRTVLAFAREQSLELSKRHASEGEYLRALKAGRKARNHFREARRLIDDIESVHQEIEKDCEDQLKEALIKATRSEN